MADRHLIDVHVLLVGEGKILLTQRRDTNPAFDGLWHLPSGKLDAGESAIDAAAREAEEEIGVLIEPADLCHVHTTHVNGSGPEPRLGLFFEAQRWIGEPTNREPDKCSSVRWFPLAARTAATYNDLWFFLATREPRITRAYLDDDSIDPGKGACALHVPPRGTAWVQTDGNIAAIGDSEVADALRTLINKWDGLDQPALTQFTCTFEQVGTPSAALWTPHHWVRAGRDTAVRV